MMGRVRWQKITPAVATALEEAGSANMDDLMRNNAL
jgi:hypothetical protein